MSKNIYKVGQELRAVPLIIGKVTVLRVCSITNTVMGKVYRAVDINTDHEYVTRPALNDETKFWDAEYERSPYAYKVRPMSQKKK